MAVGRADPACDCSRDAPRRDGLWAQSTERGESDWGILKHCEAAPLWLLQNIQLSLYPSITINFNANTEPTRACLSPSCRTQLPVHRQPPTPHTHLHLHHASRQPVPPCARLPQERLCNPNTHLHNAHSSTIDSYLAHKPKIHHRLIQQPIPNHGSDYESATGRQPPRGTTESHQLTISEPVCSHSGISRPKSFGHVEKELRESIILSGAV